MTAEEYIQEHPSQFKDELDKWLYKECNILGGCCSSAQSLSYSIAREVAEKAMAYAIEEIFKNTIEGEVGYWHLTGLSINVDLPKGVKEGDKVKVIIKED